MVFMESVQLKTTPENTKNPYIKGIFEKKIICFQLSKQNLLHWRFQ